MRIAPRLPTDAAWIRETFVREWCGDTVGLSDGGVVYADDVPALVARRNGERVGLVAYLIVDQLCEIVALVARPIWQGTGTALIDAVETVARDEGCGRLEVATTNDNLDALRFYQRRDFRLIELLPRKMDEVRARKPEVPETGNFGIPLRDVLVLRKDLG